jgi:PadR family transcriptional regulator
MGDKNRDSKAEMLPGALEMLILKTLDRNGGPMHGYGIAQFIRKISHDVLRVEEGSLYPALQRLSLKGWVEAEWATSENNRRARYYRLTREGRKELTKEVIQFERLLDAIRRVLKPA